MRKYETEQFDLQGEQWRDLIRFPQTKGIYWISNLGRYKRIMKKGFYYSLGTKTGKQGYKKVALYVNGENIADARIHDLVAEAFIRPINYEEEECHHKNHIRTDNRLQNLKILDKFTHHSQDDVTKQKMSEYAKNRSPQHRRKLSEAIKKAPRTKDLITGRFISN